MKGQISLEMIIVIAVFLAVLSLWLSGVNEATANISLAFGHQQASLAADKLATAINSICVMGDGNEMQLKIYVPGNATASYNGNFALQWNNQTFQKTAHCEFSETNINGRQQLVLTNNKGFVGIS